MFVPANVPIAAGLLMSKSATATLFWQWWNQTYNVFNNYVTVPAPPSTSARSSSRIFSRSRRRLASHSGRASSSRRCLRSKLSGLSCPTWQS